MSTAASVDYGELVARAVRICEAQGVMEKSGHVSVRDAGDPRVFWINNRHASRSTLTAADIVPVAVANGRRIGEGIEPPSEIFIHAEVYARRPEVLAICHGHPHYVQVLSASGRVQRPSTSVGTFLPEDGAPLFDSPVLINTPARGRAMADVLGAGPAVILRQHGAVTVGADVREAVVRMVCLEDNARKQFGASLVGGVRHIAGGEYATLAVENWTNAVEKFWHYFEESARRSGALSGLEGASQANPGALKVRSAG